MLAPRDGASRSPVSESAQKSFDQFVMDWQPSPSSVCSPSSISPPSAPPLPDYLTAGEYGTLLYERRHYIHIASSSPRPAVAADKPQSLLALTSRRPVPERKTFQMLSSRLAPTPQAMLQSGMYPTSITQCTRSPSPLPAIVDDGDDQIVEESIRDSAYSPRDASLPSEPSPEGILHFISVPVYRAPKSLCREGPRSNNT